MPDKNANYEVFRINLSTAGEQWIERAFNFLRVVGYEDAVGNEVLTGKMSIVFGRADGEAIPVRVNAGLKGNGDVARLTWAAQAGVFAIVVASQGDLTIDTPPSRSLVTTAAGNALRTVAATATTTATIVSNIANRQSVILRNDGATDCFVGGSTVTASGSTKGILLAAGGTMTLDKMTAAVYAICASGTTSVIALEEYSN
jgi:hypothetical protein